MVLLFWFTIRFIGYQIMVCPQVIHPHNTARTCHLIYPISITTSKQPRSGGESRNMIVIRHSTRGFLLYKCFRILQPLSSSKAIRFTFIQIIYDHTHCTCVRLDSRHMNYNVGNSIRTLAHCYVVFLLPFNWLFE